MQGLSLIEFRFHYGIFICAWGICLDFEIELKYFVVPKFLLKHQSTLDFGCIVNFLQILHNITLITYFKSNFLWVRSREKK